MTYDSPLFELKIADKYYLRMNKDLLTPKIIDHIIALLQDFIPVKESKRE